MHCHILRDGDDSVPTALVAASRQRDPCQLLIKIPPGELADLLVGSEQTTIGEDTAEVEVGVEGLDVL